LTKKKKKKKPRDDLTSAEKEGDENVSNEQSAVTKEKKSKSVAFATESSEVKIEDIVSFSCNKEFFFFLESRKSKY